MRTNVKSGIVLIGSDAHYWPGEKTTAHRGFVKFIREMQPRIVIMNGDVIDAATISRHPPIGWENFPTVQEELQVAQERLAEIEDAASGAKLIWTLGNHDARFNTRLATVASEFKGVKGTHLYDHFPAWRPTWKVDIGRTVTIKHRLKGGVNAARANVIATGRTTVTGHLHRLGVLAVSSYPRLRWGVEGGMLADPKGQQFRGYTEDGPLDWHPGFLCLTFHKGQLLTPEAIYVLGPNTISYRGKLIKV